MSLKQNACENCIHYMKQNARYGECLNYHVKLTNVLNGDIKYKSLGRVMRYYKCDKHVRLIKTNKYEQQI